MYRTFGKRLLDIVLSLIALPFVLLISLFVIPLIWLEDRGPAFYNAPRLGKGGKPFVMYKFRSMYMNAPDIRNEDGSTFNGEGDLRVTKVGRVLRKTSIDEIPQLLNVLKGDMSFVGPRPNLATVPYDDLPEIEKKRLAVRPGITGFNQAYYRNSVDPEERYKNDCIYIDHQSMFLDIKIIILTIVSVLRMKNIYLVNNAESSNGVTSEYGKATNAKQNN